MSWLSQQISSKRAFNVGASTSKPSGPSSAVLSMYAEPSPGEVSLEEFERFAISRLTVLKAIEDLKSRGKEKGEALQKAIKSIFDRELKGATPQETRWRDDVSHFVLRLAYCRTEDLRRWFISQECDLFKARFQDEAPSSQADFMAANGMPYKQLERREYEEGVGPGPDAPKLYEQLAGVELSRGQPQVYSHLMNRDFTAVYYRVPFDKVPDLVATRRVMVAAGWAYVAKKDMASLVVGKFRAGLSRALVRTAQRWAAMMQGEADRLVPVVEALSTRYLGPDYSSDRTRGEVAAADLPTLSTQSFPLCMLNMYQHTRSQHHLRHVGRMQLGLFLKGVGLPLEEALRFWRTEFALRTPADKFEKEYAYNIRHNYGKEGKKSDYTPYSCMKIISCTPGEGDVHGCPYKTFDAASLRAALGRLKIGQAKLDEAVSKARGGHYQLACAAAFEGAHSCVCETGINHPNQYYDESRKVLDPAKEDAKTPAAGAQAGPESATDAPAPAG